MKRIHVLTAGFTSTNGEAFLYPLILNQHCLTSLGLEVILFTSPKPYIAECDVLMVDSKLYTQRWSQEKNTILDELGHFKLQGARLIYSDISDSSGWVHAHPLAVADLYLKNQLLRDRRAYLKPMQGYRIYIDTQKSEDKDYSEPPPGGEAALSKLRVGWNSALADYRFLGHYRNRLYAHCPLPGLISFPHQALARPDQPRPIPIQARFGTSYARAGITQHRSSILKSLQEFDQISIGKISRWRYLQEMRSTRIVIAPFGYGEISYRDYEAFLSGACLMKPDMSHLETWPPLYESGHTTIMHRWDLSDFRQCLEDALSCDEYRHHIAYEGQIRYLHYLKAGGPLFAEQFRQIIDEACSLPQSSPGFPVP